MLTSRLNGGLYNFKDRERQEKFLTPELKIICASVCARARLIRQLNSSSSPKNSHKKCNFLLTETTFLYFNLYTGNKV